MINVDQYNSLIAPEKLLAAENLTTETVRDVTAAGQLLEAAYGERAVLVKAITQLEGAIQLEEATAFMNIDEKGFADVNGKPVKLANSEMRDMYRHYVSRDTRAQLTEKKAFLKEIEVNILKAKDRYDESKLVADMVISRSYVQANLLKFLSGRD